MRYSTEDQLREIMLRKRRCQRRQSRQITTCLSGAAACLVIAFAAVVSVFSGSETAFVADSAYGAFLLSSRSGSYVLCGIIAFVCGSLITILCIRSKRKQDREKEERIQAAPTELSSLNESTRT